MRARTLKIPCLRVVTHQACEAGSINHLGACPPELAWGRAQMRISLNNRPYFEMGKQLLGFTLPKGLVRAQDCFDKDGIMLITTRSPQPMLSLVS